MPICIAGHAGIGHVCSHSGFIQDDSQGFAVVSGLLCSRFGIDPAVRKAYYNTEKKCVSVELKSGGTGYCYPLGGLTPFECELLDRLEGENSCFPQRSAEKAFGRIYGHGSYAAAAAVEYAIAQALLNTFKVKIAGFILAERNESASRDMIGGIGTDINGEPIVLLLTINGSDSGVGPNEDLEGNVALYEKREVMEKLGVLMAPTIIVESKAYNPSLEGIEEEHLLLRYHKDFDNLTVASAVEKALKAAEYPGRVMDSAFPRHSEAMRKNVESFSDTLIDLASRIRKSTTADERVQLGEELVRLASRDYGGIIFMSDDVYKIAGAAGLLPGTGVVLSTVVSGRYADEAGIPYSTEEDVRVIQDVLAKAVKILNRNLNQAEEEVRKKYAVPENV